MQSVANHCDGVECCLCVFIRDLVDALSHDRAFCKGDFIASVRTQYVVSSMMQSSNLFQVTDDLRRALVSDMIRREYRR